MGTQHTRTTTEDYLPGWQVWTPQPEQQHYQGDDDSDGGSDEDDAGAGGESHDDDEDFLGDNDGDGDEDGEGDGDDDGDAGLPRAQQEAIARIVESAIDRRIGAVIREVRGNGGQRKGGQRRGQGGGDGARGEEGGVSVASKAEVREARAAVREYLPGLISLRDADERQVAMEIATQALQARAAAGPFDDEDRVGLEVAETVASTLKTLRTTYGKRTRAALHRQGALTDPKAGQGRGGGGKTVESDAAFRRGQERAAARHPKPK